MTDQVNQDVVVQNEEPRRRRWLWVVGLVALLLLIVACVLITPWVYRQISGFVGNAGDSAVPSVRIPGKGSQIDHSGGLPYARVNVHDDEAPNKAGFFDRTVINTENPADIGMNSQFVIPSEWFVERDFSLKANQFVDYMTVKVPTRVTAEEIRNWAQGQDLEEGISYEITSVIVKDGQECSVRGLDVNRVRTNVYIGENWTFQTCPAD